MTLAAPLAAGTAAEGADGCHAAQRWSVPAAGQGALEGGVGRVRTGVLTGAPARRWCVWPSLVNAAPRKYCSAERGEAVVECRRGSEGYSYNRRVRGCHNDIGDEDGKGAGGDSSSRVVGVVT